MLNGRTESSNPLMSFTRAKIYLLKLVPSTKLKQCTPSQWPYKKMIILDFVAVVFFAHKFRQFIYTSKLCVRCID